MNQQIKLANTLRSIKNNKFQQIIQNLINLLTSVASHHYSFFITKYDLFQKEYNHDDDNKELIGSLIDWCNQNSIKLYKEKNGFFFDWYYNDKKNGLLRNELIKLYKVSFYDYVCNINMMLEDDAKKAFTYTLNTSILFFNIDVRGIIDDLILYYKIRNIEVTYDYLENLLVFCWENIQDKEDITKLGSYLYSLREYDIKDFIPKINMIIEKAAKNYDEVIISYDNLFGSVIIISSFIDKLILHYSKEGIEVKRLYTNNENKLHFLFPILSERIPSPFPIGILP